MATAKTVTCLNPSTNESSLIFPAINPPNSASIKEACRNSRFDSACDIIGLMKDVALAADWLRGANIMFEMIMIINKNMKTEK